MGSGDWNDGMNRVGSGGKGESVWLGWFLHAVLGRFEKLAERRHDADRAVRYRKEAGRLAEMLELAWDGDWYRRAYFDDGSPTGSLHNEECRIDGIAQSWAVLSGAAPPRRAERAMDAVRTHLIRRSSGIVLLLAPPWDQSPQDPGYIKGYVPGIRENGGQYTQAALWTAMAIARLGSGDEAMELFHMLNPINRTRTEADVEKYKVEPYVIAADVYAHPLHLGRGGWTWYTGSAGWAYRMGLESLLGFTRRGSASSLNPCIPSVWKAFSLTWRHEDTRYEISVENPAGCCHGVPRPGWTINRSIPPPSRRSWTAALITCGLFWGTIPPTSRTLLRGGAGGFRRARPLDFPGALTGPSDSIVRPSTASRPDRLPVVDAMKRTPVSTSCAGVRAAGNGRFALPGIALPDELRQKDETGGGSPVVRTCFLKGVSILLRSVALGSSHRGLIMPCRRAGIQKLLER